MAANQSNANAVAEAAVWVARLRSNHRPTQTLDDLRRWLSLSEDNRSAFERVTGVWELAGAARIAAWPVRNNKRLFRVSILPVMAVMVAFLAAWLIYHQPILATGLGERRLVVLPDGSRATLNTDTRLRLRFSSDKRVVLLERGEASFAVQKDSLRPFIVEAGDTRIVAVGTDFDVRWIDENLAVTLAKGVVRVVEKSRDSERSEIELKPGQRLEASPQTRPRFRFVDLDSARAWQSGQVVFDETPLTAAVAEMNRYSERKIKLTGFSADRIRISGVFKAGRSDEFVNALRDSYRFEVTRTGDDLSIATEKVSKR